MHEVLSGLASKSGSPSLQLQSCEYLNISVCPATETNSVSLVCVSVSVCVCVCVYHCPPIQFNMMVYNPLAISLELDCHTTLYRLLGAMAKYCIEEICTCTHNTVVQVTDNTCIFHSRSQQEKLELVFNQTLTNSVIACMAR